MRCFTPASPALRWVADPDLRLWMTMRRRAGMDIYLRSSRCVGDTDIAGADWMDDATYTSAVALAKEVSPPEPKGATRVEDRSGAVAGAVPPADALEERLLAIGMQR
jgi:hypothetical protein